MMKHTRYLWSGVLLLVMLGSVLQAASADKAIAAAESRRKGAESSLREILLKSPADKDEPRAVYDKAAASQNAWLALVTKSIAEAATIAPETTAASEAAAAALMDWVRVGGEALDLPALTAEFAVAFKNSLVQEMNHIGSESWKSYAGADARKRTQMVNSLNAKLRWKLADEMRGE